MATTPPGRSYQYATLDPFGAEGQGGAEAGGPYAGLGGLGGAAAALICKALRLPVADAAMQVAGAVAMVGGLTAGTAAVVLFTVGNGVQAGLATALCLVCFIFVGVCDCTSAPKTRAVVASAVALLACATDFTTGAQYQVWVMGAAFVTTAWAAMDPCGRKALDATFVLVAAYAVFSACAETGALPVKPLFGEDDPNPAALIACRLLSAFAIYAAICASLSRQAAIDSEVLILLNENADVLCALGSGNLREASSKAGRYLSARCSEFRNDVEAANMSEPSSPAFSVLSPLTDHCLAQSFAIASTTKSLTQQSASHDNLHRQLLLGYCNLVHRLEQQGNHLEVTQKAAQQSESEFAASILSVETMDNADDDSGCAEQQPPKAYLPPPKKMHCREDNDEPIRTESSDLNSSTCNKPPSGAAKALGYGSAVVSSAEFSAKSLVQMMPVHLEGDMFSHFEASDGTTSESTPRMRTGEHAGSRLADLQLTRKNLVALTSNDSASSPINSATTRSGCLGSIPCVTSQMLPPTTPPLSKLSRESSCRLKLVRPGSFSTTRNRNLFAASRLQLPPAQESEQKEDAGLPSHRDHERSPRRELSPRRDGRAPLPKLVQSYSTQNLTWHQAVESEPGSLPRSEARASSPRAKDAPMPALELERAASGGDGEAARKEGRAPMLPSGFHKPPPLRTDVVVRVSFDDARESASSSESADSVPARDLIVAAKAKRRQFKQSAFCNDSALLTVGTPGNGFLSPAPGVSNSLSISPLSAPLSPADKRASIGAPSTPIFGSIAQSCYQSAARRGTIMIFSIDVLAPQARYDNESMDASARAISVVMEQVKQYQGWVMEMSADQLLISWNMQKPDERHAVTACGCALAMAESVSSMDLPWWSMVISTGVMYIGKLGNDWLQSGGVVGDPVRQVRALVTLSRALHSHILITQSTQELLLGQFRVRILDVTPFDPLAHLTFEREGNGVANCTTRTMNVFGLIVNDISREAAAEFNDAFSSFCVADYEEADRKMAKYLTHCPDDIQAKRIMLLSAAALKARSNGEGELFPEPYVRAFVGWANYEDEVLAEYDFRIASPTKEVFSSPKKPSVDVGMLRNQIEIARRTSRKDGRVACDRESINSSDENSSSCSDAVVTDTLLPVEFVDANGVRFWRSDKMLGEGAYGAVWLGMTNDGSLSALKFVKLPPEPKNQASIRPQRKQELSVIDSLVVEIALLSGLAHENIEFQDLPSIVFVRKLASDATFGPTIPEFQCSPTRDFLEQCLRRNPDERPTSTQLLRHAFLLPPAFQRAAGAAKRRLVRRTGDLAESGEACCRWVRCVGTKSQVHDLPSAVDTLAAHEKTPAAFSVITGTQLFANRTRRFPQQ
eukprot:gene643-986_t